MATKLRNTTEAGLSLVELIRYKARNPGISSYVPHPKQLMFHTSNARRRLYIGGNRAGKTVAGAVEAVYYARGDHPYKKVHKAPTRGRIVATDLTKGINEVTLPMLKRWMPTTLLIDGSWEASYEKLARKLTLVNGSTIEFMSYEQELDTFAGTSRHWTWFDEEPPEDIYKECLLRLIDVKGDLWATLTPVEGMTWIYEGLYLPGKDPTNLNIAAIEVETDENPHIDPEELELLVSSFSAEDLEARRKGKIVQREGLIYKKFSYENNVIDPIPTDELPKDYTWVASMDHGLNNPTAWLWAYIDHDGNIVVFDEHYLAGHIVSFHADAVNRINYEHGKLPDYVVGDPTIRNRDPLQGSSVLLEYAEHGIYIGEGNNNHAAGLSRVSKYIEGVGGRKLFITANCVNLIRELSRLHWATFASKRIAGRSNLKEDQHKKDDHAADALRYLVMSRPEYHDTGRDIMEVKDPRMNLLPDTERLEAHFIPPKRKVYIDPHLGEDF